jgi:hypothetical protein
MKMIAKTALISATLFGGYYYGNNLATNEVPAPERDFFEQELNDMLMRNDIKTQTRIIDVPANECIVSQKDLTYAFYARECLSRNHAWFKI